ncbi:hypothetical protein KUTeg_000672 [Tegillarca granosa]|uniref:EGF-like domain-containing protein n=1 Tax=Tegillarca granosa TaxID=220873 RepID=A0ABQ9FZK8_TEGGR|nr:hypothetical protein KUTeg_000672 [Tegillarca granosa]
MASTCIYVFIVSISFMMDFKSVHGVGNGLMVSSYSNFQGRITAYQGDIDTLRTLSTPPTSLLSVQYSFITSLTAEPKYKNLYLLDVQYKSIYKLNNTDINFSNSNMSFTRLHEGISVALGTIVFDWISRNIYWTDRYHNWISMMPVTTNDTLMFRAVVEEGVSVPVALAIDPKAGLLFWSDTQPSVRIEWSNLLGEKRDVMLVGNMKFVISLSVDPSAKKLYYADYIRQTVEEVDYGGLNRKVIIRLNTYQLTDITFYQNYLCLLDQRYYYAFCITKSGQRVVRDLVGGKPWGACVFDENTQSQPFTANHSISGKGLIYTNGTDMCILHITVITGSNIKPVCIVSNLGNGISYLQADSNNGKIHFWNSTGQMLQTYDLLSNKTRFITYTGMLTGLFFDWIADDLYWSEGVNNRIKLASLNVNSGGVIAITQTPKPRYLTGNPHKNMLYWISGEGSSVAILGGKFDGTGIKTIVPSANLHAPFGLVYDEVRNRLYWIDRGQAESIVVDGTGSELHLSLGPGANSLLIYKDYLVWTTNLSELKAAFLESSNSQKTFGLQSYGIITGICAYDSRLQRKEKGPCEIDNGGCQHICIPSSSGPKCRCKIGFTINGTRCQSVPLKNNFALLVDFTHDMIFQIPTGLPSVNESNFVALDIPEIKSPIGVVYDAKTGYIYWSELYNKQIKRVQLGGTNVTTILKLDKLYPDRMVMDQTTGYIYYTAIKMNGNDPISYIGVLRLDVDLDKPKNKQLVQGLHEPRCLAIHPKRGLLFWGEIGQTQSFIGKANMDGSESAVFYRDHVTTPIGLAMDYTDAKEYLYWADLVDDQIKRISIIDKQDFNVFYVDRKTTHPSDVFLQGAYLYYISWNKREISKINKSTGKKVDWMPDLPDLGRLDNLKMFPEDLQRVESRCENGNGGCSTFCLAKPNGVTVCSCEDGVKMRTDGRTCENVCMSTIPNGIINKNCTIYPGALCGYTCGEKHKRNTNINQITCLKNTSWSEINLCGEITCNINSISIQNGKVKSGCLGKVQDICEYSCDSGFESKNPSQTFSAYQLVFGQLHVTLRSGFDMVYLIDIAKVLDTVLRSGMFLTGGFNKCEYLPGKSACRFYCSNGYVSTYPETTVVECQSDATWTVPPEKLVYKYVIF